MIDLLKIKKVTYTKGYILLLFLFVTMFITNMKSYISLIKLVNSEKQDELE